MIIVLKYTTISPTDSGEPGVGDPGPEAEKCRKILHCDAQIGGVPNWAKIAEKSGI
jgi:hypothetical protein